MFVYACQSLTSDLIFLSGSWISWDPFAVTEWEPILFKSEVELVGDEEIDRFRETKAGKRDFDGTRSADSKNKVWWKVKLSDDPTEKN